MFGWQISDQDRMSYARGDSGRYLPGPESFPRASVTPGALHHRRLPVSAVFPPNAHDYWIYTSAGHDPSEPADLLVGLDGGGISQGDLRLITVLDNLISDGELPPLVGVFVAPGTIGPGLPIYGGTGNRSVEYDSTGDAFARFVHEELLPDVTRAVAVTSDPDRRGILGISSGAVAAFSTAWERPDSFRKVLTGIGSFVDIRGAHEYPSLIRKTDPKPLRVFLQSGSEDLDTVFGDWGLGNMAMASALAYRGYDHRFEYGVGGHGTGHLESILPDALRWLWRASTPSGE